MSVTANEIRSYAARILAQWIDSKTDTLSDGRKHRIRTLDRVEDGKFHISLEAAKVNDVLRKFEVGVSVTEITEGAPVEVAVQPQLDVAAILTADSTRVLRDEIADLQRALGAERASHEASLREVKQLANAELTKRKAELELEFTKEKRAEADKTAARSRIALVAKIAEHFAPLLKGFKYNFKDARHIGEIVDFIVYDGLEDGEIRDVVFLEVKTRRSGARVTNPREKLLRDAIEGGRVRYEIFVPDVEDAKAADPAS